MRHDNLFVETINPSCGGRGGDNVPEGAGERGGRAFSGRIDVGVCCSTRNC